jgi:signal transduction histidine kinase
MRHVLSFATLASHELRTPLTVVRNELEDALRDGESRESLQSTLASTYDEVLRLSRVVEDLMSIGTMQAGTFRVERSRTDLTTLLQEFCEEASLICTTKHITVEPRLEPGCVVDLDAERFRHVLFNLLDNAIRHTPEGGSIGIETRLADDVVLIGFRDSGGGIDPSELPYVFDPFRRAERDGARGEGAGLGLALARWITEAHGGSIQVSRTDSQGTTFSITLPVSKSH